MDKIDWHKIRINNTSISLGFLIVVYISIIAGTKHSLKHKAMFCECKTYKFFSQ